MALRNAYLSGLEDRLAILTDRIFAEISHDRHSPDEKQRAQKILRVSSLIVDFMQAELRPEENNLEEDAAFDIASGRQDAEYAFRDDFLKQGDYKDANHGQDCLRGAPR